MRNVQVSGRVANFGKVYKAAEGEKSAFCVVFLNMSLDRKDEASGYTATVPVKDGLYVRCEMIDNWAANADNAEGAKPAAKAAGKPAPAKPGAKKPAKPARPSMA